MKIFKIILLLIGFTLADSTFVSTYITTNYVTDIKQKSNPNFVLDQGVLGITDAMANNLTANLYFRIYKDIYKPYIDAGNVIIGTNDLKLTLGQQFYNYGYMITRMATYPLLTDHIWTQQPGMNLSYTKNSNVIGLSILTKQLSDSSMDYLSVMNLDNSKFGFTRLSSKLSREIVELDFYHEHEFKMVGFDFEIYNNFEVNELKNKSGGYYIDLFLKKDNKTYSLRFDALTDNYLKDILNKEYSAAYTVDLNDKFWFIAQYSFNEIKKNTIYIQLGYWRNITFNTKKD